MGTSRLQFLAIPGLATLLGAVSLNSAPPAPTFSKDIAPILYSRCASCHSDSLIAPFSLVGYENARNRAPMLVRVTQSNYMPPWKAKAHYGEFRDVAALTPKEKDLIARWSKAGAPEGDRSLAPTPPSVAPGWRLGTPDMVLAPKKPTRIPAQGRDFFRDYLIDPQITKPTWVKAIDFRPSNQGTIHHIIPMLIKKEEAEKLRKIKYDFDDDSWKQKTIEEIEPYNTLGFWSTGAPPFMSPDGTAFLINPGDCFILDLHYKPKGKVEMEQPQLALYFDKAEPKNEMSVKVVSSGDIYLQPNQKDQRVYAIGPKLRKATTIYAVWPHMHYLGRTMKAWVKFPGGYAKPLIAIDDWDADWQLLYYLKTPLRVPAGSKIYVTGTYDNTKDNPRNPNNPPRVVEAGESSRDEMLFFEYYQVEDKDPVTKAK